MQPRVFALFASDNVNIIGGGYWVVPRFERSVRFGLFGIKPVQALDSSVSVEQSHSQDAGGGQSCSKQIIYVQFL